MTLINIGRNTKTFDKFIRNYTDNVEDTEYFVLGSREFDFSEYKNLKGIFKCGVGLDNIPDINVPIYYPSDTTKEIIYNEVHAFTCSRIFAGLYRDLGTIEPWSKSNRNSMNNKTLLVIGASGNIGSRVVESMSYFFGRVLKYDLNSNDSLEDLVRQSDVISLHVPLTDLTRNLINTSWLKSTVCVVNTSRGRIINEDDMYDYLIKNNQSTYASDVFSKEPYTGKLTELHNCILTPHVASTCDEFMESLYKDFLDMVNNNE